MGYQDRLNDIGLEADNAIHRLHTVIQEADATINAQIQEIEGLRAGRLELEEEIERLEQALRDCQNGEDPDPDPPLPRLNLETTPGNGFARLRWSVENLEPTKFRVGRDGTDTGGYGPWSTDEPANVSERIFLALRNGVEYNLFVEAYVGDEIRLNGSVKVTPVGETNPDPDPDPPVTGTWLSGAGTQEVGQGPNCAKYLSDYRGRPVEIGCTWPNTPHMYGIQPYVANSWADFPGAMVLCVQPETDAGANLQRVANGEFDAWWRQGAQNAYALRNKPGFGQTYFAPFYEYNGDWMKWSVVRTAAGMQAFRQAFERVSNIWRQNFPGIRVVLAASMNRDTPVAMRPNPASFDLWGGTTYNAWQPWSANGAGAIAQMDTYRVLANDLGKPIGITEWSNSGNRNTQGGGGEAPQYMRDMHAYFKRHAGAGPGQVEFETLFNIGGYALDHLIVNTNGTGSSTQPQTAAAYRDAWRQG